jgi:hypothetical protein
MSLFRHKKSRNKRPVTIFPYSLPGLTSLLRRPASHEHFGHLATASITGTLPDSAAASAPSLLSELKITFQSLSTVLDWYISDADETSITEGIQHVASGMPVVNVADALQPSGRPST